MDKDLRISFANDMSVLLLAKNDSSIDNTLADPMLKRMYDHFQEHVRNVYQFIADHIPLFYLYELHTLGADSLGLEESEFETVWAETYKKVGMLAFLAAAGYSDA